MEKELHINDKNLFEEHPSLIWESLMKIHPTHINHTTPFFGPLLYWLVRCSGGDMAMEIGVAQGYTSWFMAQGIKDNNRRFQMKGKYIPVDVCPKRYIFDPWKEAGIPVEYWQMDSAKITIGPTTQYVQVDPENQGKEKLYNPKQTATVKANSFDVIFQDGWHNLEHNIKELDQFIYPALKEKGNGYLVIHDTQSWCEKYWKYIDQKIKAGKYKLEFVRFIHNYGLAICRKMDNYDYEKIDWPEGDQPASEGFVY